MNVTEDIFHRAALNLVPKFARRTDAANEAHRYAIRWPTHLPQSLSAPSQEVLTLKLADRLRMLSKNRLLLPSKVAALAA